MKAGVIGVVDGSFDAVATHHEQVEEDGHELARRLEVDRVFSLPDGGRGFAGRAAAERLADRTETAITDDGISVSERTEPATRGTQFVGVPGEFVVVESGRGTFAFDLLARETDTAVERATLDLEGFFDAHGAATPWKVGFHGASGAGNSGVFHGEDLRAERDLDALLADATLTQVGLTYGYDGVDLKVTAARSGYVEVYRPAEFDAAAYLAYLRDAVLPHVE